MYIFIFHFLFIVILSFTLIVKIDEKLDLYNAVDLLKNNNKINLVVLIHRESEQQKELSRSRKNQEIEEWRDK